MNLPGRLRLTTLGDVLGALYRDGTTGVLALTEAHGATAGRVHRVHFAGGLVAHVDADVGGSKLGVILERRGFVDAAAIARLPERFASRPGRRTGEILVEDGATTLAAVATGLRIQRRERLERLFLLDDARLAFHVARSSRQPPLRPLAPVDFLHGRVRQRDRATAGPGRRRDPARIRALATLGLTEPADPGAVQRAFRQLAARMHPDRFPTASTAERVEHIRRFAEISAAYHSLVA